MDKLAPGLTAEIKMTVTEADTADRWGSGSVPVLGTPTLVGLMEQAAVQALAGHLPAGHTSVGGRIDVHHLAPTPVGLQVRARAELLAVEGRRLVFRVEAWDEAERIGEATHERFVVDEGRFVVKAYDKAKAKSKTE
jgi:fluoroacetyl-CoA thioesterase